MPGISSVGMVNGFLVLSYKLKSQPYLMFFCVLNFFFSFCVNSSICVNVF